MLFGLNESSLDTTVEVEALIVPKHLDESILGISAYGQAQAEKIYETALELHGKFVTTLQRGISEGKLSEAVETILQEGALSGFVSKVKEFFKKIWATIKGMFEKFMAWLDSKMKSDKDFIAKYKKILSQKASKVSDLQYKGHEWNLIQIPESAPSLISKNVGECALVIQKLAHDVFDTFAKNNSTPAYTWEAKKQKIQGQAEKIKDLKQAMGADVKSDGSDREDKIKEAVSKIAQTVGITADDVDELATEYREKVYGGEADVQTGPDVNAMITIVEGYDKDKKAAEKLYKAINKEFNNAIKEMEKAEKAELKKTPANLQISTLIDMAKAQSTALNKMSAIYLQALKDRRDESRAVLAKVVTYKGE